MNKKVLPLPTSDSTPNLPQDYEQLFAKVSVQALFPASPDQAS